MQQNRKCGVACRVAWCLAIVVIAIVVVLFVVAEDDCWPEPEPVPADCKPGRPCPVDGDTGGVEVKPLPSPPVEPPVPLGPQETTGGATG